MRRAGAWYVRRIEWVETVPQELWDRFESTMVFVALDKRIPAWARVTLAIACLPIPGILDNLVQIGMGVYLAARYWGCMRDAWIRSATEEASIWELIPDWARVSYWHARVTVSLMVRREMAEVA